MLSKAVAPLLELISKETGFENITLLCGTAPRAAEGDYMVSAVHHGKTKETVPRNFYDFNAEGFRLHVLPLFCQFLAASRGETPQVMLFLDV